MPLAVVIIGEWTVPSVLNGLSVLFYHYRHAMLYLFSTFVIKQKLGCRIPRHIAVWRTGDAWVTFVVGQRIRTAEEGERTREGERIFSNGLLGTEAASTLLHQEEEQRSLL